jgi:hypothetical protein
MLDLFQSLAVFLIITSKLMVCTKTQTLCTISSIIAIIVIILDLSEGYCPDDYYIIVLYQNV